MRLPAITKGSRVQTRMNLHNRGGRLQHSNLLIAIRVSPSIWNRQLQHIFARSQISRNDDTTTCFPVPVAVRIKIHFWPVAATDRRLSGTDRCSVPFRSSNWIICAVIQTIIPGSIACGSTFGVAKSTEFIIFGPYSDPPTPRRPTSRSHRQLQWEQRTILPTSWQRPPHLCRIRAFSPYFFSLANQQSHTRWNVSAKARGQAALVTTRKVHVITDCAGQGTTTLAMNFGPSPDKTTCDTSNVPPCRSAMRG